MLFLSNNSFEALKGCYTEASQPCSRIAYVKFKSRAGGLQRYSIVIRVIIIAGIMQRDSFIQMASLYPAHTDGDNAINQGMMNNLRRPIPRRHYIIIVMATMKTKVYLRGVICETTEKINDDTSISTKDLKMPWEPGLDNMYRLEGKSSFKEGRMLGTAGPFVLSSGPSYQGPVQVSTLQKEQHVRKRGSINYSETP